MALRRKQISDNHKAQANHNKQFIIDYNLSPKDPTSPYRDWSITTCFYAGLHWVQTYLNLNNGYRTVFSSHKDRNNYLIAHQDPKIQAIVSEYITLFNASMIARYTPLSYNRYINPDIQSYYDIAFINIPTKLGL